jgi:hypothetical protein
MTRYQILHITVICFIVAFVSGVVMMAGWSEVPERAEAAESQPAAASPAKAVPQGKPATIALESGEGSAVFGGGRSYQWDEILDKIVLMEATAERPRAVANLSPIAASASGGMPSGGEVKLAMPAASAVSAASSASEGGSSSPAPSGAAAPGGPAGGGTGSEENSSGDDNGAPNGTTVIGSSPSTENRDLGTLEAGKEQVESVYTNGGAFLVETTGSRFEYSPGKLEIYRGLNFFEKALLGTIRFQNTLSFSKDYEDSALVVFRSGQTTIKIAGDSTLTLQADPSQVYTLNTAFDVYKSALQDDMVLLAGIKGRILLKSPSLGKKPEVSRPRSLGLELKGSAKIQPLDPPMVLWVHNIYTDSLDALETALSSGLVTHVIMKRLHRYDCVLYQYAKAEPMVPRVIEICHQRNIPVVLARNLWPSWRFRDVRENTLYQADYYIQEIKQLRQEADELGVRFVALDTEPYGDSPLKNVIKERRYSVRDLNLLDTAIQKVIATCGKIDFVFPAGSNLVDHPYNIMAKMGRYRICEHTYYDDMTIHRNVKYPYEIVGVFIDTLKTNTIHSHLPLFLVDEIFDRAEIWVDTDGVFLWKESRDREDHAFQLGRHLQQWGQLHKFAN